MSNLYRELTAREKQAIRRLVISECANYDHEYGCLPLDGACYMFTVAFVGSSLCKWFQNAVLPLDPALEAVFSHRPLKACKRCGRKFPVNGRQAYCEACVVPARKAAAAARVRKHRGRDVTL
ncbi:MAG: cysteine-rich VLP protein [Pseudoflavonifractor sp.]|nr:cysteine-rich VLP protein [Pseudoflavonifractor sp.]